MDNLNVIEKTKLSTTFWRKVLSDHGKANSGRMFSKRKILQNKVQRHKSDEDVIVTSGIVPLEVLVNSSPLP